MKTCIITGVNGQLGQFLAKYLQDNEPKIRIVGTLRHKSYDRQPYIFDKDRIIFELMDLSDSHSIANLVIKYKPDYFINTAANAFVGESWAVPVQQIELNLLGVLHQLEAIRKHSSSTRYFNMGTSEEFASDINDGKLQDEKTLINPKSPYGCAKAGARYLVNTYRNSYGLYALQGWTFNFESELRGEKYVTKKITKGVARICHAIKSGQPFEPISLGNLDSMRSWQFAGDVVDGIWRQLNQEKYNQTLLNKLSGYPLYMTKEDRHGAERHLQVEQDIKALSKHIKTYIMSAPSCHTVREFVEESFRAAGIMDGEWRDTGENEVYVRHISKGFAQTLVNINPKFIRPHDVTYLNGDATAIKNDLGWNSTLSFPDLVKRMVEYDLRNN